MMLVPGLTFGHVFGTDFSLPLPLWMFMFAGMAAVVLSFVVAGLMYDSTAKPAQSRFIRLPMRRISLAGQIAGLLVLALVIATGFFGEQTAERNFNVTFFWVIMFVGLTYLTVLLGNFWKVISPFKLVAIVAEQLVRRGRQAPFTYPARWGHGPALLVFFVLISLELVFDGFATRPSGVSIILLVYMLASMVGAFLFGSAAWFRYGDFFSVFFRQIGRLAPLSYASEGVRVRRPLSGLLKCDVKDTALLLFILFMLASTSFDGFTETGQYAQIQSALPAFLGGSDGLYGVLSLAAALALFLLLYLFAMAAVKLVTKSELTAWQLARLFAPSLIPIAVGYHVAHYLTYLLLTGQDIIRLASDPFGWGWNALGTAGYRSNTTFISPYTTWYLQVAGIIIGHVAAVYVAHRIAMRVWQRPRTAMVSQLPLMVLMVMYTVASLWIIAQPVYIAQAQAEIDKQREQELFKVLREPPIPIPIPTPGPLQ